MGMVNRPSKATTGNAVEVLIEGFLDDPFYVWVTPDQTARVALLSSLFSLEVGAAAAHGLLWSDERGVVVLVPPHRQLLDDDQAAEARELVRNAFQRPHQLMEAYKRRLHDANPDVDEAWYLQYLAVPASKRSQGQGSSLMCDVLAEIAGAPLWLHTGRASTVAFYSKFGLAIAAVTSCEPTGPSVYTLWRGPADQ